MKLIEPSVEIIEQKFDIEAMVSTSSRKEVSDIILKDMYKHIERCGRTCYKSEDLITDESAKPFVDRMINSQHYAMLEHGTLYFRVTPEDLEEMGNELSDKFCRIANSKYSVEYTDWSSAVPVSYVTTNFRVIIENEAEGLLEYVTIPHSQHQRRMTAHFVCNRQVSHEFVRHRVFSFAQESTRYCNYTKGKFGGELTFINPCWIKDPSGDNLRSSISLKDILMDIESSYAKLIDMGWKPQQAATILPNALKTELVMTGYMNDWSHFFDLRYFGRTGAPHPQAKELAEKLFKMVYDDPLE